jgi:phosphate:Na+ symporter
MFHLLFNVLTIVTGMLLLPLFTNLVLTISGGASIARTIANAHMLFNSLGVIIMLPILGLFEKALERLFPDRHNVLESRMESTPTF